MARAPSIVTISGRTAVMPIDPVSAGTWIGGNDAGLVLVLQDVTPGRGPVVPPADVVSRGTIIPSLLGRSSPGEVVGDLCRRSWGRYQPFQLIVLGGRSCLAFRWDGAEAVAGESSPISHPLMFTTSGLGDDVVAEPRRRLFEAMFEGQGDWELRQDEFHRHHWPECPHLSICMRRPDAHTVSLTVVTLAEDTLTMAYYPDAPDQNPQPVVAELPLAARTPDRSGALP